MNLNKAFKKRNKLQEEINELRAMMSSKIIVREKGEEENRLLLNGFTAEEWLAFVNGKYEELSKLLIAIDKANAEIKPLLSEINIYKAQKSFLTGLNDYIAKSLRKYYYSETNKTVYYELNLKQEEILALIAKLSEKIENLEEKIQKLNFETQVLAE